MKNAFGQTVPFKVWFEYKLLEYADKTGKAIRKLYHAVIDIFKT